MFKKQAMLWTAAALGAVIFAVGLAVFAVAVTDSRETATVLRVVDGDTVDVDLKGNETRIRLLNVDTPETKHPDELVQCLGPEATEFLETLLPVGEQVELEYDLEREDHYGRTLAGIFHEDELINARIAAEGLGVAVVYEPNRKFYDQVKNAEDRARSEQLGLFSSELECALPRQIAVLQEQIDNLGDALPTEIGEVEQELAAVNEVHERATDLYAFVLIVDGGSVETQEKYAVLASLYDDQLPEFRQQLASSKDFLEERDSELVAHKEALDLEAERKAEEERKKAEEERIAEEERQAEAERQRAAAEAAELQRQQEAEQQRRQQAQVAEERARQQQREQSSGSSGGSGFSGGTPARPRPSTAPNSEPPAGYGTDSDYPGYTGPRCYAPGGRSWRPC